MSKNATEAKRIYLFCLFYIEAEYYFTTTMDPMTMKEYTIVDCEAEEIEDLAAELAKTDDVYSYHCKLLELQTALDAYRRKVEALNIKNVMEYTLWNANTSVLGRASTSTTAAQDKLRARLRELTDAATTDDGAFLRQYIDLYRQCLHLGKEVHDAMSDLYFGISDRLSEPQQRRNFRDWLTQKTASDRLHADARRDLLRAIRKARSCDDLQPGRDDWQLILDETRRLVQAALDGQPYEAPTYLTPDDLRTLIARHAALYRCIDDTLIDADGVFDVDVAIDVHSLMAYWDNTNYDKLQPLLAYRLVIGEGIRGAKPRRAATAGKAVAAATPEAQVYDPVSRCFVDTSDAVRQYVQRVVDTHYGGQPATLALIEWALCQAQVIRVEGEHRLFIEALVAWGILADPGAAEVTRMCSTMSTKTARLRQKISEADRRRIEGIAPLGPPNNG